MAQFQNGGVAGPNVTVLGGSLYNLNNFNQGLAQLTLRDGADVQTGTGLLSFPLGGAVRIGSLSLFGWSDSSTISGRLDTGPFFTRLSVHVDHFASLLPPSGAELELAATVSGSGGLTKDGAGHLRLSANNPFFDNINVNEGTLIAANSGALGASSGAMGVNSNGTLAVEGGITIVNKPVRLDSAAVPALDSLSGSNTWNGNIILASDAAIRVNANNGYLQVLGAVNGPGGLTKLGPGALQFWGVTSNSYAGLTTVSEGVLEGSRVNLLSVPGDAVIGDDAPGAPAATLRSLREQQIRPTANVDVRKSGALDLFKVPGLAGPNQRLRTLTGNGAVRLGDSSFLTISNEVSFDFYGPINGLGSFIKDGPAAMVMWGDWAYSGNSGIYAGTLTVNGTSRNSAVTVHNGGRLRGDGRIFNTVLTSLADPGGLIYADSEFPDHQGGDLEMDALVLTAGSGVVLEFYGPSPTGGNDTLIVDGNVSLNGASLSAGFLYPPREGDVVTLIRNTTAGPIGGIFAGWPQGTTRKLGDTTVTASYTGGDGNDFTLTVTNLALANSGYRLAEGNGNQTVEPDECNLLYLTLVNRGTNSLTITNAIIHSLTPGVTVTIASATYPTILAGAAGENLTPFQFRTDPMMACGAPVELELIVGAVNEGTFALTFSPVSGNDCAHPTGGCESCTVVMGQLTTNLPTTLRPLYFVGAPSICYPPKECPGIDPNPALLPVPYVTHAFTNNSTNELCLTAQLHFDCPGAPTNALGAAAYLDSFDYHDPCARYLGDSGVGGPPYPPFSFRVPPATNFVILVFARTTNVVCDRYALELFGLPCPPPPLAIAKDAAPGKVRVNWSSAYPDFRLQSVDTLSGVKPYLFTNVSVIPTIVDGRYTVTNATAGAAKFYRLTR